MKDPASLDPYVESPDPCRALPNWPHSRGRPGCRRRRGGAIETAIRFSRPARDMQVLGEARGSGRPPRRRARRRAVKVSAWPPICGRRASKTTPSPFITMRAPAYRAMRESKRGGATRVGQRPLTQEVDQPVRVGSPPIEAGGRAACRSDSVNAMVVTPGRSARQSR
jgi:hypothetical protein